MSSFLTAGGVVVFTDLVPAPRPAGSDLETGRTAAQCCIGTEEVKRGSHILLDRRSHKLLGRRNDNLINRASHMLLGRGRHTLNYRDAIKIWHTGINAIRMNISEVVAKLQVLVEPVPCLGEEV